MIEIPHRYRMTAWYFFDKAMTWLAALIHWERLGTAGRAVGRLADLVAALLAGSALVLSACGSGGAASDKITEVTGVSLAQRCQGYRQTLDQYDRTVALGLSVPPKLTLAANAARIAVTATCAGVSSAP